MSVNPELSVPVPEEIGVHTQRVPYQKRLRVASRKRGCMVVLLGPDGSGKSSVLAGVIEQLRSEQIPVLAFHYRPQCPLDGIPGQSATDPYGQAPRGWFQSVLKLGILLLRFNIGYLRKVRTHLRGGGIALFDRYYHDMLVDPRRYRYGGPKWLARLAGRLIPSPDLWILLDAPVEVLQRRKQEVAREESNEQRQEYRRFTASCRNVRVIDSARALLQVVAAVRSAIVET